MASPVRVIEAVNSTDGVAGVCHRVLELRRLNELQWVERRRVRQIMNNRQALAALVGKTVKDPDARLPIANLMLSADMVLGQKLGRPPDIKVDPPITNDSDRARKRADKRARILDSHDRNSKMDMLLPQVGRWLPGYGFVAGIIRQGRDRNGQPFPKIELRDPYQSFPGQWGAGQQPADIAFIYTMSAVDLAKQFPTFTLDKSLTRVNGGVLLEAVGTSNSDRVGWMSQSGSGIEVYEYYNQDGCWWVVPQTGQLLSYVPNLLSTPQFRVCKRFVFDELAGAFDHAIGVMANMVRIALLNIIAAEDAVMAEMVITGDMRGDTWRRGRNAVNFLTPGSTAHRENSHVPGEVFQQMGVLERQLRLITGHSPSADGESPGGAWVTGKGLEGLDAAASINVREYQTVIRDWLEDLDYLRLEFDEKMYTNETRSMYGVFKGSPFAETYTPSADISGDYMSRRVYGAMAGFDDATKIVSGLQLLQADVIDLETFRENIDGLEDLTRVRERVIGQKAEEAATTALLQMAEQGDQRAMAAAIQLLPAGKMFDVLSSVFLAPPDQQQVGPDGQPVQQGPAPDQMPPAAPPDIQSVLARLTSGGQASATVRSSGRVAA